MKHLALSLLFLCLPLSVQASMADPRLPDLVEKLSPAVVNISTTQKIQGRKGLVPDFQLPDLPPGSPLEEFRDFFEQFRQQMPDEDGFGGREAFSLGSGFVIDPSGVVVTNNHVIAEAEEIKVIFQDGRKLPATVLGRDAKTDLAVLKIQSDKPFAFVQFGDSDKARVGQNVFAIGNPYGLGGTVTSGIISARARDINAGPFDDFLQTDAAINRGNSGGPLFDMDGKVIGINTAIFSPTGGSIGIGFAVPSRMAEPIIDQLKQGGKISRGWLGVKIQTVTDEIAESMGLKDAKGALVAEVSTEGPADKAGMKPGDIILSFDGKPVTEMRKLPRMVAETKIGSTVDVTLLRKGEEKKLRLTLGELDEAKEAAMTKEGRSNPGGGQKPSGRPVLGMTLQSVTPELRRQASLPSDAKGVLVVGLERDSEAARRGLKRGDVIQKINEEDVATPEEVEKRIQEAAKAGRKSALMRVLRAGDTVFVTVPTKEEEPR